MAVAGQGGSLLESLEIGEGLKLCVGDGAAPEVLRPPDPKAGGDGEGGRDGNGQADDPGDSGGGLGWKSRRYRRTLQWGSVAVLLASVFIVLTPLGGAKGASVDPSVKLRAKGVNGACAVVQLTVDGHALALFPTLDRGDVAVEVSGDLFPGIQPAAFADWQGRR